MSALPPAMEATIMRTGFVGYVSAAHADVPTIAPAIAMQVAAIRFMIARVVSRPAGQGPDRPDHLRIRNRNPARRAWKWRESAAWQARARGLFSRPAKAHRAGCRYGAAPQPLLPRAPARPWPST